MTPRMKKMDELLQNLTSAVKTGDWNRVLYWSKAIDNAAREVKEARRKYREGNTKIAAAKAAAMNPAS